MTKKELIEKVASKTGLSKHVVRRCFGALISVMKLSLANGRGVKLRGFGHFYLQSRAGKKRICFKPAETLVFISQPSHSTNLSGGTMEISNETQAQQTTCFGLDVGTSRIVLASGSINDIKSQSQLNAFVSVPYSKFTENILRQNKIPFQRNGNKELLVFGNESEKFANSFNVEARRPMCNGLLNPNEPNGTQVIRSIIELLVKSTDKHDTICFSIPGIPRGGEANLVYHEGMIKNHLQSLGYTAKSVNEGLAVVFAELEKENFTGIGISCGGGMCNVCFAFMSVPVFSFSIPKAGDYIDQAVAAVTNELPTRIRVIKEESLDLSRMPKDKYENAMHIYYEEMILTLVEALRAELSESRNMPKLDRPIPIVISGGTASPKGFLEKFERIFKQNEFPIKISEIRVSKEPLTATARGCYIAAVYEA
ncbi:MAG: HU family DNA-binding protein [Acidobacteriota bacterium]|nr:HU family DNA-binding protein [Blastocatellia bacterium]MDW8411955.1 HU family DNA-binding protein [Acidobacteriota bacterium]